MGSNTRFEPDHLYSVVFSARHAAELAPILEISGVDVGCRHPSFRRGAAGVEMCALVAGRVLAPLLAERRWRARVVSDQTVASLEALKFVGKGNGFRAKRSLPEGTGRLVPSR